MVKSEKISRTSPFCFERLLAEDFCNIEQEHEYERVCAQQSFVCCVRRTCSTLFFVHDCTVFRFSLSLPQVVKQGGDQRQQNNNITASGYSLLLITCCALCAARCNKHSLYITFFFVSKTKKNTTLNFSAVKHAAQVFCT